MSWLSQARKVVCECDSCGEPMSIPPGVRYRGGRYHPQCARRIRRGDISIERVAPELDRLDREIREALDV